MSGIECLSCGKSLSQCQQHTLRHPSSIYPTKVESQTILIYEVYTFRSIIQAFKIRIKNLKHVHRTSNEISMFKKSKGNVRFSHFIRCAFRNN